MDPLIRNLVAAAYRIGVRVDPIRDLDTKTVTLSARDSGVLVNETRRLLFSSIETTRVARILAGGRRATRLTDRDVSHLAHALDRIAVDADRDKRIRHGQYVGPMSGAEAVTFMRAAHGL